MVADDSKKHPRLLAAREPREMITVSTDDQSSFEGVIFQAKQASFHLLSIKYPVSELRRSLDSANSSNVPMRTRDTIKYSTAHIAYPLLYGICLPSSCSESDLDRALNSSRFLHKSPPFTLQVERPHVNTSNGYFLVKMLFKILISLLILTNVIAYLHDAREDTRLGCLSRPTGDHSLHLLQVLLADSSLT